MCKYTLPGIATGTQIDFQFLADKNHASRFSRQGGVPIVAAFALRSLGSDVVALAGSVSASSLGVGGCTIRA
jgi:hypothetical protein